MAVYTQADMDRKLLIKIIGWGNEIARGFTPQEVMHRYRQRLIMLVRWTFLRYCEKHRINNLSLEGFGHGLKNATIHMWMDEPYMKLYKTDGDDAILFQYSAHTLKELYYYIKGLERNIKKC